MLHLAWFPYRCLLIISSRLPPVQLGYRGSESFVTCLGTCQQFPLMTDICTLFVQVCVSKPTEHAVFLYQQHAPEVGRGMYDSSASGLSIYDASTYGTRPFHGPATASTQMLAVSIHCRSLETVQAFLLERHCYRVSRGAGPPSLDNQWYDLLEQLGSIGMCICWKATCGKP